jgi:hypothetical protein
MNYTYNESQIGGLVNGTNTYNDTPVYSYYIIEISGGTEIANGI